MSHSHGRGDQKEATDVIYDGWQKRYNAPVHPGYYPLWMQVALAIFRTTTSHAPASFGTQTLPREEPTRFQSRLKSPDDFYLEKPRNGSCRWASWAEAVAYGKQPFCPLGLFRCNGGGPKSHLLCPIGLLVLLDFVWNTFGQLFRRRFYVEPGGVAGGGGSQKVTL